MKHIVLIAILIASAVPLRAQEYPVNDDWNTSTANQLGAEIAKHPAGPAAIVWTDCRNGLMNSDIYLQVLGWKGFPLPGKANLRVNADTGELAQGSPDITVDGTGRFTVVWQDEQDSRYRIMGQRYRANADTIGGNFLISGSLSTDHVRPSVAAAAAGQFIVVWGMWHDKDIDPWDCDVYAQWYTADGTPAGNNYRVNLDTTGAQYNPRIAMTSGGRFVIAWVQVQSGDTHIYARVFDGAGQSLGPEFQVSQTSLIPYYSGRISVAMREDGAYMIVWSAYTDGYDNIFARGYNSSGEPQSDEFMVNQRYGLEHHRAPEVEVLANSSFGIAWESNRLDIDDIYYRAFALNGVSYIPEETIAAATGIQRSVAMAADLYQNRICVWEDTRNGNYDIYISNTGLHFPNHAFAGSGFDGIIPLSWDPPYMDSRIVNYTITRQSGSGAYETVAVIDPSTRLLPNQMLDWIDSNVENGIQYRYRIKMEVPESIGEFTDVWARPSAGGHRISSPWARITPEIDGTIYASEWNDALECYIEGPESLGEIRLHIKNDASTLYLAFSDVNADRLAPAYIFGMLCDGDNSGSWPSPGIHREGAVTFTESDAVFTSFSGTYPDGLVTQNRGTPEGVVWSIQNTGGWITFEASIELDAAPLHLLPGETIGAAFWIADPGTFFNNHYGNSGAWPRGALWEAAETLGKLTLASPADTLQEYAWTMLNHDRERTSWARDETELAPPFDSSRFIPVAYQFVSNISFYDDTYYLTTSNTGLPNRFLSLDAGTEALNWNFDVPNSVSAVDCQPAVSHQMVFCGGQGGDGIFALDRTLGYSVWSDPIGSLLFLSALIDGPRVYVAHDSLYCFNAADGERIWVFAPSPLAGWISTPALDSENCYLNSRDTLWALNKYSGSVLWKTARSGVHSLLVDGGYLYTYSAGAVQGINRMNGGVIWSRAAIDLEEFQAENKMALAGSTLCYAAAKNAAGKGHLLAMDKYSGSLLWDRTFANELIYTPTIANDVVYIIDWDTTTFDGSLWALDLTTGDSLFHDTSRDYRFQPVVAGHRLMVPGNGRGFTVFWNEGTPTEVKSPAGLPDECALCQNYPNPFNPETSVRYRLDCLSDVTMEIIDIRGRRIRQWRLKQEAAGSYTRVWDGRNEQGEPVPSGVYFFRLQRTALNGDGGTRIASIKMALVK